MTTVTKSKHAGGVGTTVLEQVGKYQNLIFFLKKKKKMSRNQTEGRWRGSALLTPAHGSSQSSQVRGHLDTLTNVACAPAGVHSNSVNSLVFLCVALILKSSFLFLTDLFLRKRSGLAALPREQFPGREGCRSWKSPWIRYRLSCSEAPSTLKHYDKLYFFILSQK